MASYDDDKKKEAEPDILISDAIPADGPPPQPDGPPVPPGHNRFYCEKCRTVGIQLFYPDIVFVLHWLLYKPISFQLDSFVLFLPHFLFLSFSDQTDQSIKSQPYDLPQNATSWRCARCSTFNSITPAECPMCNIL